MDKLTATVPQPGWHGPVSNGQIAARHLPNSLENGSFAGLNGTG